MQKVSADYSCPKVIRALVLSLVLLACSNCATRAVSFEVLERIHVHGEAVMLIALREDMFSIDAIVPGVDFVGFEHNRVTHEEVDQQFARMDFFRENPALLVKLPQSAECEFNFSDAGGEAPPAADSLIHFEYTISYVYRCERPEKLRELDIFFFDHLPSLRELHARIELDPGEKWNVVLRPGTTRLELKARSSTGKRF